MRYESGPRVCRRDVPAKILSLDLDEEKEGTTISERVPVEVGLRTGIRLPGTEIRDPEVTELELGVGLRGAGGLGPNVLSRRDEGVWYMVGIFGTGGGRVPISHLGFSPGAPCETIEDCLLIVLCISVTGLREPVRDSAGL